MQKTQFKGVVMLLLTAFIWGSSFVAQDIGMDKIEAFTYNGVRTLLGAIVLIPIILVRDAVSQKKNPVSKEVRKAENKKVIINGSILGVILCVASNFQQFAFNDSSAGKIAFITAFYMMFVPVFGLFLKKKVPLATWFCVICGCVGLYFLCIAGKGFSGINKGDFLAFICSIAYAVHILAIERFAPEVDSVKLSCTQFMVSGIISCILMFIFETPNISDIMSAWVSIAYSGVLSCGIAYTLQIVGQKFTESTVASLLMCTESLFGVVCSAIVLKEKMTAYEYIGCAVMFVAIVMSQVDIPALIKAHKNRSEAA